MATMLTLDRLTNLAEPLQLAVAAEPAIRYGTDEQKKNAAGLPGWTLTVGLPDEADVLREPIRVTVYSATRPDGEPRDFVQLRGLTVGGTANGLWFSATGCEVSA